MDGLEEYNSQLKVANFFRLGWFSTMGRGRFQSGDVKHNAKLTIQRRNRSSKHCAFNFKLVLSNYVQHTLQFLRTKYRRGGHTHSKRAVISFSSPRKFSGSVLIQERRTGRHPSDEGSK